MIVAEGIQCPAPVVGNILGKTRIRLVQTIIGYAVIPHQLCIDQHYSIVGLRYKPYFTYQITLYITRLGIILKIIQGPSLVGCLWLAVTARDRGEVVGIQSCSQQRTVGIED